MLTIFLFLYIHGKWLHFDFHMVYRFATVTFICVWSKVRKNCMITVKNKLSTEIPLFSRRESYFKLTFVSLIDFPTVCENLEKRKKKPEKTKKKLEKCKHEIIGFHFKRTITLLLKTLVFNSTLTSVVDRKF